MATKYRYKCPTELGFKRVKLSKSEHNSLFKYRKRNLRMHRYEYYQKDKQLLIHCYTSTLVKCINILAYPFVLLLHGIANFKKINREYSDMFHEKERGNFMSDTHIYK